MSDEVFVGNAHNQGVKSINAIKGAAVIVAGANITVTPAGQNITIAASGGATVPNSSVSLDTLIGRGTGAQSCILRYTNNTVVGADLTYATSATFGDTITINTTGLYAISMTNGDSAIPIYQGVSLNSVNQNTTIFSIPKAERILLILSSAGGYQNGATTIKLTAGDVIRAHDDSAITHFNDVHTTLLVIRVG